MVATDERYSVWVSYFEAEKEQERFERIEATVDKVTFVLVSRYYGQFSLTGFCPTHEEIICVGNVTADAK